MSLYICSDDIKGMVNDLEALVLWLFLQSDIGLDDEKFTVFPNDLSKDLGFNASPPLGRLMGEHRKIDFIGFCDKGLKSNLICKWVLEDREDSNE